MDVMEDSVSRVEKEIKNFANQNLEDICAKIDKELEPKQSFSDLKDDIIIPGKKINMSIPNHEETTLTANLIYSEGDIKYSNSIKQQLEEAEELEAERAPFPGAESEKVTSNDFSKFSSNHQNVGNNSTSIDINISKSDLILNSTNRRDSLEYRSINFPGGERQVGTIEVFEKKC